MGFQNWARRKTRQATKAAGKRYGMSYGRKGFRMSKNSLSKVAKDVMMIKNQLNVEKKYKDTDEVIKGSVGQVDGNNDGFLSLDITPSIPQGVQESERVGNSIKGTGLVLKMNTIKQDEAHGERRLKVCIVRCSDPSLGPNSVTNKLFDTNPITGVVDYHSNIDYTSLKDKRLQILRTEYLYLRDNVLSPAEDDKATAVKTIAVKLNDVIRYTGNGSADPENIRYYAIILCDNGNRGSASTLATVFITNGNTGVQVNAHSRFWYVDN